MTRYTKNTRIKDMILDYEGPDALRRQLTIYADGSRLDPGAMRNVDADVVEILIEVRHRLDVIHKGWRRTWRPKTAVEELCDSLR